MLRALSWACTQQPRQVIAGWGRALHAAGELCSSHIAAFASLVYMPLNTQTCVHEKMSKSCRPSIHPLCRS